MANTSGQPEANDTGDWNSNKEMNPASNSSATENGLLESDSPKGNDSEPHVQPSETEGKGVNPGRTPGKAEGVEDAEERGNQ